MFPPSAKPAAPPSMPHHAKKTAMREALMKLLAQGGQKTPASAMPPMAGGQK